LHAPIVNLSSAETRLLSSALRAASPQPGLSVTPSAGLETTESEGNVNSSVVLNAQPADLVIVKVTSSSLSEGIISTSVLTFTPSN
jgi:hypothetical protein